VVEGDGFDPRFSCLELDMAEANSRTKTFVVLPLKDGTTACHRYHTA